MEEGVLSDVDGAPAARPAAAAAAAAAADAVVVELRADGTLEARARDVTLTVGRTGDGLQSVELLLAALGACTVGTVAAFALRSGIAVEGLRLELEPVQATGPERVSEIHLRLRVDGEVEPRRLASLRRAAERCKVHATLERPPIVTLELEHGRA